MAFDITSQPVKVLVDGHDSEGRLIFANDQLSAVIVRLDGEAHAPDYRSLWNLEAGFGKCNVRSAPLLQDAGRSRRLGEAETDERLVIRRSARHVSNALNPT